MVARRAHNPEVVRFKSHLRNQKRFHSRYNFGYGILLYMRKTADFCPFTARFGGFEGVFSYVNDKSAILCPGKTEAADFVSFKGSIVQGLVLKKALRCHIALTTLFNKKIFRGFSRMKRSNDVITLTAHIHLKFVFGRKSKRGCIHMLFFTQMVKQKLVFFSFNCIIR